MSEEKRQLFVFWQFNGDNRSFCNQFCVYCYGDNFGKERTRSHCWNGKIVEWEQAFERLDRQHGDAGIYFVFSYGEAMGSKGFKECVEMIGKHPTWTLCIVTNLSYSPEWLIQSTLGREKRVFICGTWHPTGVLPNLEEGWERFKHHCLMLQAAEIPLHILYCWYPPQIKLFPAYFKWFDEHNIRVGARRFVGKVGGRALPFTHRTLGGKDYPREYTEAEWAYLYSSTCPKVTKYGLKLVQPIGKLCTAGKDMILVKYDGTVGLCADAEGYYLGNIFDSNFKLSDNLMVCPSKICGGDYGMLHLPDPVFGSLPERLFNDTFFSQVEDIPQGSPVPYHNRTEMLKWLEKIENDSC
jgi:hypothetical protein